MTAAGCLPRGSQTRSFRAPVRLVALVVAVGVVAAACANTQSDSAPAATGVDPVAEVAVSCEAVPQPSDRIDPSPRADVPSALEDPGSVEFPEPLVALDEIRSGGPPPDGIPAIDNPLFLPVCAVDFLSDNEPVVALRIGAETRAYPIQILTWHEIVNDVVDGVPVSVTYCPLCNSAFAFDRRVDDQILDFGTSGSLYRSNLVMYDRQTESLWVQFTSQAVVGVLTGTELDTYPMSLVSWADFRAAEPDALVLSTETGFDRDYGRNPYPGYDDVNTSPFLFDGDLDGRLAAKTRILGIRRNGDAVAIVRDTLLESRVMHLEVGGDSVVVFAKPGTASALDAGNVAGGRDVGAAAAYEPVVNGQALTFTAVDDRFVDAETQSAWNILGESTDGPLMGERLTPVEHDDSFWFAWGTFQPDSRIIP